VDLDEKMFARSSCAAGGLVGSWQRQPNELGGVKPLAFGQYGERRPGFEQLLDQPAGGEDALGARTSRTKREGTSPPAVC
jgi:hypothetical protein